VTDLYAIIDEYLQKGSGGVLATIVKKLGAAPREEGAKMFVANDGKYHGAKLLHYSMNGKQLEDEGMICGGNVDIFLEPVKDRYRALYRELPELERQSTGGS
jgi:xanthine dehydrogenase accessory factor